MATVQVMEHLVLAEHNQLAVQVTVLVHLVLVVANRVVTMRAVAEAEVTTEAVLVILLVFHTVQEEAAVPVMSARVLQIPPCQTACEPGTDIF